MADVTPADKGARESAAFFRRMAELSDNGNCCGGTLVYFTPEGLVEREAFGEIEDGYYIAGHLMSEAMRFIAIEEEDD